MTDFEKWVSGYHAGMLNDPDDFARFARAAACDAWKAAQPEWQPIETAPDDTPVLTYWIEPEGSVAEVMSKIDGKWYSPMVLINQNAKPTHWQPLPAPPEMPSKGCWKSAGSHQQGGRKPSARRPARCRGGLMTARCAKR